MHQWQGGYSYRLHSPSLFGGKWLMLGQVGQVLMMGQDFFYCPFCFYLFINFYSYDVSFFRIKFNEVFTVFKAS